MRFIGAPRLVVNCRRSFTKVRRNVHLPMYGFSINAAKQSAPDLFTYQAARCPGNTGRIDVSSALLTAGASSYTILHQANRMLPCLVVLRCLANVAANHRAASSLVRIDGPVGLGVAAVQRAPHGRGGGGHRT